MTIPAGLKTINTTVFYGCKNIGSVTIPEGVTSIGQSAFGNCERMSSVAIPHSVTSIDYGAFNGCVKLITVYYTGSMDEWNALPIGNNNEPLQNASVRIRSA